MDNQERAGTGVSTQPAPLAGEPQAAQDMRESRPLGEVGAGRNQFGGAVSLPPGLYVTRDQFDSVMEVVWSEITYQNSLPRRTADGEAKDIPGFLTLGRRYMSKAEAAWADSLNSERASSEIRKLAAIFVRALVYTDAFYRVNNEPGSIHP